MYVCEDFARKLYGPMKDPSQVYLTQPTNAFDNCGITYPGANLNFYSSNVTTTAYDFLNSVGVKSYVMNDLGAAFKVQIIT